MGVQVFDGTCRDIADQLPQAHRGALHCLEGFGLCNGDWGLFNDLLVSSLNRTVSAKDRDVVSVLIGEQLHLQVSGVTGELHNKDRRPRNLSSGGVVKADEFLFLLDLSDTLTTTTFGGFDHDGETDLLGLRKTFLGREGATLIIDIVVDGHDTVLINPNSVDARSRPRYTGHLGVLCNDRRRDLITQRAHSRCGRTDKDNLLGRLGQRLW